MISPWWACLGVSSLVQSPFVIAVAPPPFPVSPACTDALISLAGAFADMQIFPFPPFFASPLTPPPRVGPRRSLIGRNREPTIVISPSPPPPSPTLLRAGHVSFTVSYLGQQQQCILAIVSSSTPFPSAPAPPPAPPPPVVVSSLALRRQRRSAVLWRTPQSFFCVCVCV